MSIGSRPVDILSGFQIILPGILSESHEPERLNHRHHRDILDCLPSTPVEQTQGFCLSISTAESPLVFFAKVVATLMVLDGGTAFLSLLVFNLTEPTCSLPYWSPMKAGLLVTIVDFILFTGIFTVLATLLDPSATSPMIH